MRQFCSLARSWSEVLRLSGAKSRLTTNSSLAGTPRPFPPDLPGPVAEARVRALALSKHAPKDRDFVIDVVDDPDFVLGFVVAVKASCVLGHRPLPGDRHGEHEGVEPRVVEALADIATDSENNARAF